MLLEHRKNGTSLRNHVAIIYIAELYVSVFVLPVCAEHLDLTVTPTTENIFTSLTVLLDPENVGIVVKISLLSFIQMRYSLLHVYFRLMAAIFDLPVTATSHIIYTSPKVLMDAQNVGVAVGIALLS